MVVHVFYLSLYIAVDALAVRAVGQPSHYAQAIRTFFTGKQLCNRHSDALTSSLATHTHNFLA